MNNLLHKVAAAKEFAEGVKKDLPGTQVAVIADTVLDLCEALVIVNDELSLIERRLRRLEDK